MLDGDGLAFFLKVGVNQGEAADVAGGDKVGTDGINEQGVGNIWPELYFLRFSLEELLK